MEREDLISLGRRVIKERREGDVPLSESFMQGFEEGIAEFIAVELQEGATDILEELTSES